MSFCYIPDEVFDDATGMEDWYNYSTRGVCASRIRVLLSDDGQNVEDVQFIGGCNGNLKAIAKLVQGKSVDYVVEMLEGNICGDKKTSCADQLTIALKEAQKAKGIA